MNEIKRHKNWLFYVGLAGIFLTATGIQLSDLSSWVILWEKMVAVALNPYLLITGAAAVVGVFINPTTKGLRDKAKEEVK